MSYMISNGRLLKSKDLSYWKNKLLEILSNSGLKKSKGYPVGTIREWKGKKYKKVTPNKWARSYTGTGSRGEKQAIRNVMRKISNASSMSELASIVSQNMSRFRDESGKVLPIVQEFIKASRETDPGKKVITKEKSQAIEKLPKQKKETVTSPDFLNWFGDWISSPEKASKVTGEHDIPLNQHSSKPVAVYHGTARGGFSEFSTKYQQGGLYGTGFYFTEDKEIADSYADNKDASDDDKIRSAVGYSIDKEKVEYLPESGIKKVLNGLREGYPNPNWDEAITSAITESYETGKGYSIDKMMETYEMYQELAGKTASTIGMGRGSMFKKLRAEFPKLQPVVPDPEVFEVYLDIKNPLDLDGDMEAIANEILDSMEKTKLEEGEKRLTASIKKIKDDIKWNKENFTGTELTESMKRETSFSGKDKNTGNYKWLTYADVEHMSDKEMDTLGRASMYEFGDNIVHFKHLADTIPDSVIKPWAKDKGYITEYKGDSGKMKSFIGDGDIPGTKENVMELVNMINEHGLTTYDSVADKYGVKHIPSTKDGKPSLQTLSHVLGDGWGYGGGEALNNYAKEHGYDGLSHTGGWNFTGGENPEHKVWIAFEPNQIKATTSEKFDPTVNNIYKAIDRKKKKIVIRKSMSSITNPPAEYDRKYKLQDRIRWNGLDIAIENKKGSYREGKDRNGKPWKTFMNFPYGRITGSKAVDNEGVDCVSPDTKILMSDYTEKEAQDIQVGDFLIGSEESPQGRGSQRKQKKTEVTAIKSGISKMMKITMDDGTYISTTPGHLHSYLRTKDQRWKRADELKKGDILTQIYKTNENKENDKYKKGYLNGAYKGDGCIRFSTDIGKAVYCNISKGIAGREVLDRVKSYWKEFGIETPDIIISKPYQTKSPVDETGRIVVSTSNIAKLNITGKHKVAKAQTVLSEEMIDDYDWCRGFLSGFYDTDGHLNGGWGVSISQVKDQKNAFLMVSKALNNIGLKASLYKSSPEIRISSNNWKGSDIAPLTFVMSVAPAVKYKRDFTGISLRFQKRKIINIEEYDGYYIAIETSLGTFIANGYFTHNCYVGPDDLSDTVYVVHQNDPLTGRYDEDKVLINMVSKESAIEAYLSQYDNPDFLGSVSEFSIEEFKQALKDKKGIMLYQSPLEMRKRIIIKR